MDSYVNTNFVHL